MKAISLYWKYLRYFVWLGLMLTTAGLVSGILSGWEPLPLGLLIGGIVLIGLWFLLLGQARPEFWGQRSTQASTNALIAIGSVLVILLSLNVLGTRYSQRIDLTENQIFTLAPETQTVLQDLDQPAKVWIFDATRNPSDQQLLESYERQSDQFSYEYADPNAQPVLAQEFGIRTLGEVHLEVGDRTQLVQRVSQVERLTEPRLTNQLVRLVRDRNPIAYFTVGHGEYSIDDIQGGFSLVRDSLEQKNFDVAPLDLSAGVVPDNADVVVVAGPQQEFFEAEVDALDAYLDAGGGLLLLIDPNTNPGLEDLLNEWGVELDDRLILDTSGQGQAVGLGPAAPLITNYGDHPITAAFENGRSFYPVSRPVEIEPKSSIQANPILITNEQARAEDIDEAGEINVDPNQPATGSLNLGVALSRAAQTADVTDSDVTDSDIPESNAPDSETEATDTEVEVTEELDAEFPGDASDEDGDEDGEQQSSEPSESETSDAISELESAEASDAEASDADNDEFAISELESNTETDAIESDAVSELEAATADTAETAEELDEESDAADSAESAAANGPTDAPEADSEAAEAGQVPESRLVVIGNSTFATDGLFNQQLNGDVFLNAVNWLTQEDDATLSIRAKEVTDRRIVMTPGTQIFLGLLSWLILPLIGFGAAVFMWWRRR